MDKDIEPRRRRPARPPSAAYLERAALAYLARFASGRENLCRVLRAKARRRAHRAGLDWTPELAGEVEAWIAALAARLAAQGLVDDRAYASGRVRSLRARGTSERSIRARLAAKGLDRATIDDALGGEAREAQELAAAVRHARRRRLGPWRDPDRRAAAQARDLAAMVRAGFAFPIARRVIAADDRDRLEAALDQGRGGT
jgi:regulatory protein